MPALPGADGILLSAQIRQMLVVLDTWLAAAIAGAGIVWRIGARDVDPAAMPVLALLVGIALSTQAQSGAGLDATRHRLLPMPAWRVVLARDAAYLLVQAALAAGRYPALYSRLEVRHCGRRLCGGEGGCCGSGSGKVRSRRADLCDPSGVAPISVFLVSVGFCAYTLFVYPLVLALASRLRRKAVRRAPLRPSVTVILPVYNGERWIAAKLESILRLEYPARLLEILVLSDGSTDATETIVRDFTGRANIRFIALERGGKAAALNAGIACASGEVLFFTDVRQDLAPESLARLVECFADPTVGAVSGELVIRDGAGSEEASVGLYWKYEKWIRKAQSRIDSVIGATGCIYAMRRELAAPLPPGTLNDDMCLPLAAFFRGYRVILEEGARAYDFPTQLASEFRRKVRTLAGVYQIMGQYPALLGPRNRMWLHFFSHKLARLLMPWAMLAALAASLALPGSWRTWALAAQAAGYGLAAADLLVPEASALKRLSSPARTFVTLMAASLCAVAYFFVPAGTLWGETRVSALSRRGGAGAAQS